MKRVAICLLLGGLIVWGGGIGAVGSTESMGSLKLGAQLYDNWLKMTGKTVEGNHPAYPAEAKKSGSSTWRCKECHGWDYIGKDGRYASGSHYTGIKGLYDVRTRSGQDLQQAIAATGTLHDFTEYLTLEEIVSLVRFINEGLIDISVALNADGTARGDAEAGKQLYAANCADCHGADGNAIDFKGDKDGVQGVGYLAVDNPQESLHKIRWGHPGSDMPSLIADVGLDDAAAINILSYSQTLP
ncbi:c-type cytochrome [Trichloromonas sp.]|uniref:c-type cytochrome n=1 Tax=Trichloromonas sp. TaxID=3069249 RepID=UPI003D81BEA8